METVTRFFQDPGTSFFLFGPRGTGKSTWLRQNLPGAILVDLLRPEAERLYRARPEALDEVVEAQRPGATIILDEIQRAPELLTVVHRHLELRKDLRFVLTGSSARKLKRAGVDLLAGRALLCHMHPFLAAELGERFVLSQALEQGMLPIVWSSRQPRKVLQSYVGLYVREEVQQEGLVREVGAFARFLEAISLSHGAALNLSEVARECQVGRKTVEGYVQILEDLMLSFRVPVFTRRARRELAAHPKFYWFDAGVFLSARPRGPLDSARELSGLSLEGLVAQHLRAWIDLSASEHSLSYWRTRAGREVDFVVYGPDCFAAFEVKRGETVHPGDLAALKAFTDDYPEATPVLLYGGSQRRKIANVLCIPVEDFLRGLAPGSLGEL